MVAGNVKYIPVAIHKVVSDSGIAEKKSKNASQAFETFSSLSQQQKLKACVCNMFLCCIYAGERKREIGVCVCVCAAKSLLAAPRSQSLHSRQIKCRSAQFESQHPIILHRRARSAHRPWFLLPCCLFCSSFRLLQHFSTI